jgi:hypothetical protein
MSNDRNSRLLLIFVSFVLLLNYPLISLVDQSDTWLGMPVLYFYIFFIWLLLIVVVGLVVRKRKN